MGTLQFASMVIHLSILYAIFDMKLENSILGIQLEYYYSMATKTRGTTTTTLILATFALMTVGIVL
jgi:hypothetical protein